MLRHKDKSEVIYEKQRYISEKWIHLCANAILRKVKLLDSFDHQRFWSDYRDIISWVMNMKILIYTCELTTDITVENTIE